MEVVVIQVRQTALAELGHIALEDRLCTRHEDLAVGCNGDPHTEAVRIHLTILIREATSEGEELLSIRLMREVRRDLFEDSEVQRE